MSRGTEKPLEPDRFEALLRERASSSRLSLPLQAIRYLAAYLAELDRWRRRMNLTGRLSSEELADHALESLAGLEAIAQGSRLVDVGSGAGFPGLPIGIVRPDVFATLAEPRAKRAAFLRHAVRKLQLPRITVFEGRIEDSPDRYDVAVTRAVGGFDRWLASPSFLRKEAVLLLWTALPPPELPRFRLEKSFAIPGSSRRIVALYREQ